MVLADSLWSSGCNHSGSLHSLGVKIRQILRKEAKMKFRATVSGIKVNKPTVFWDREVSASTKKKLKEKIARVRKQMRSQGFIVSVSYEPSKNK